MKHRTSARSASVREAGTHSTNLPPELSSFVGRGVELAEVDRLLDQSRLVTLTGAGGAGKTRLALRVAAGRVDRHPHGVWWIDLAPLEDKALAISAVIDAIRAKELPGQTPLETLLEHLKERNALLVLDNCEHLLADCAHLTESLLGSCARLGILATSRAPLQVPAEVAWRVPSLSVPKQGPAQIDDLVDGSEAVRLFVERALQVRPNFQVTEANAAPIAHICRELDGIPLAIELAAARTRMMEPEQIALGLRDRFHLLTGGSRTALPRHQTLEASISWSYGLLSDNERVLCRRLSVFAGGCTLNAAEEVCSEGGIGRYAVLDLLTGLVDKSLVSVEEEGAEARYRLLETVRQFSAVRLCEAGEVPVLRDRHLAYFSAMAESVEPALLGAAREDAVMRMVGTEMPNLRSALDWGAETHPEAGLRMVKALSLFWLFTGRFREGESAYRRALESANDRTTPDWSRALASRAHLAQHAGAHKDAHESAQAALAAGERCGDPWTQGRALNTLGRAEAFGNPPRGRALLERSMELAKSAGDEWCWMSSSLGVAVAWYFEDEFETARPILESAFEAAKRLGYRRGMALHWWCLAWEATGRGRLAEARKLAQLAEAVSEEVGDPFPSCAARCFLSHLLVVSGDWKAARVHAAANLEQVQESGVGFIGGLCNRVLGIAAMALDDRESAREHLQAAPNFDRRFPWALCWELVTLGTLHRLDGKYDEAHSCGREALEIAQRVGSRWMQGLANLLMGRLALESGNAAEADRYVHEALGRFSEKGLALYIPECLDGLAAIAADQESFAEAARLVGAASSARERLGIVRVPPEPQFWNDVEHKIREGCGSGFEEQLAAGQALELHEAVSMPIGQGANASGPPEGGQA